MTTRGQELFNLYVADYLNCLPLAGLGLYGHAHNFMEGARVRNIPISEVTEEVGPLHEALFLRLGSSSALSTLH